MRKLMLGLLIFAGLAGTAFAAELPQPGKVTIINLSDGHCVPCKMMAKQIESMQREYGDVLAAVTINALKDRVAAEKYKPQALPTLVFFNRDGEEVRRHTGVMDEAAMRAQIEELMAK